MYSEFREDPWWTLFKGHAGSFWLPFSSSRGLGTMEINRVVSWLCSLSNWSQNDAFRSRCSLVWLLLLNLGFVRQFILLSCLIVAFSLLGKQKDWDGCLNPLRPASHRSSEASSDLALLLSSGILCIIMEGIKYYIYIYISAVNRLKKYCVNRSHGRWLIMINHKFTILGFTCKCVEIKKCMTN